MYYQPFSSFSSFFVVSTYLFSIYLQTRRSAKIVPLPLNRSKLIHPRKLLVFVNNNGLTGTAGFLPKQHLVSSVDSRY